MKRCMLTVAILAALITGLTYSENTAQADYWQYGYGNYSRPYSPYNDPYGYRRGWQSGYRAGYRTGTYQSNYWGGGYYPYGGYDTTFYLQNGIPAANGAPLFVPFDW